MSIYEYDEKEHIRLEREDVKEEIFSLIEHMAKDGLLEQIPRLSTDVEFYNTMKRKYQI